MEQLRRAGDFGQILTFLNGFHFKQFQSEATQMPLSLQAGLSKTVGFQYSGAAWISGTGSRTFNERGISKLVKRLQNKGNSLNMSRRGYSTANRG